MSEHTHRITTDVYGDGQTRTSVEDVIGPPPVITPPPDSGHGPIQGATGIRAGDTWGDDDWKALQDANAANAVNVFVAPGDVVSWNNPSGYKLPKSPNPIWIGCDGGRAELVTQKWVAWFDGSTRRGPVTVSGLDVRPSVVGAAFGGFRLFNCGDVILDGVTVRDYGAHNVSVDSKTEGLGIYRSRILDARSVDKYRQGVYASCPFVVIDADTVLDRNGVMDANGETVKNDWLLRAHNLYTPPSVQRVTLGAMISTRSAGIGAKIQALASEIDGAVFAYNPIGLAIGSDPSKPEGVKVQCNLSRLAVIDGTDYPESPRSIGVTVNSVSGGSMHEITAARLRRCYEIYPEYLSGIDALDVTDNTCGQYGSIGYWGRDIETPSPPVTMSGNVSDTDTGLDGWTQRAAAPSNPAAGLETFTGKDTPGAFADLRAGRIDTAALLDHIIRGLR